MDSSSTTTSTTATETTTTSLPLHAKCDPRNDVCDETAGLMCNEDHYECRYGTKKTTATTVTVTVTDTTTTTTAAVPAKPVGNETIPQIVKTNAGNGNGNGNGDEETNNHTDNGEADVDDAAAANVGMIVGIVLPILILIGIGVAIVTLRKKEQGRQRAYTRGSRARNNRTRARSNPTQARSNPVFGVEEAAAAANTDRMADYEEIDENEVTNKQPANAYEQPVTQPVSAPTAQSQVDDGTYEMPDPRQMQTDGAPRTYSLASATGTTLAMDEQNYVLDTTANLQAILAL